ncbi:hypothetical protein NQ318_000411 [Aromia moschata]|uniref:Uncharacterized protein n=1 Tax=Aromia moschata TaxID=1265417 RepID=A0AAV8YU23_9CUCU|nr:hypothetical protein NQ318_000411 [Aromia moschata]
MRLGLLGRLSDPINGHLLVQQNSISDLHRPGHPGGINLYFTLMWLQLFDHKFLPLSRTSSAWHPSGEMHISVGQGTVPMDTRNHKQENDDVEAMSTDSSSSSSSDSQ